MALTTKDVITQDFVRETVEEVVEEELIYREAFREIDASNIGSNSYTFYIEENDMGRPQIVGEGEEAPRHGAETPTEHTVQFDKYMGELVITMEAMEDSRIDLSTDQVNRQARDMSEDMNRRAFNYLIDGIDTARGFAGSDSGTLTYSNILEGREMLVSDSFNPDLLIADVAGVHDLLNADNFLRATDVGDRMRREGAVGRIAGMEVMEDDTGLTPGDDAHSAVMVDTDYFGYEGERTPVTTEEYGEKRNQSEIYRIFTRMGWLATQPKAGVVVQG